MISMLARGTVVGPPVEVQTDGGSAVVFVLAPGAVPAAAREELGPWSAVCEVWCRDHVLAKAVLSRLTNHQSVFLVGELVLKPIVGPLEDELSAARVHIEAHAVGLDLGS
jgi:hypothetical protein